MSRPGCELRRGDDGTMRGRDKESYRGLHHLPMSNARPPVSSFLFFLFSSVALCSSLTFLSHTVRALRSRGNYVIFFALESACLPACSTTLLLGSVFFCINCEGCNMLCHIIKTHVISSILSNND